MGLQSDEQVMERKNNTINKRAGILPLNNLKLPGKCRMLITFAAANHEAGNAVVCLQKGYGFYRILSVTVKPLTIFGQVMSG